MKSDNEEKDNFYARCS